MVKNPASESYFKLVKLIKKGAYCSHYKNLGAYDDLKKCLKHVKSSKEDVCAGGDGYFSYDPDSGWCSCCTNADDAESEFVETENKEVKIYKTISDPLPHFKGCYLDTPN